MKQLLTWLELKIYRQVLLMVAISVGVIIAGWAGETFGGARDLAAPIGDILGILWPIFGVFLFMKVVTRKPASPAPQQSEQPVAVEASVVPAPVTPTPSRLSRRRAFGVAGVILLVAIGIGWWLHRTSPTAIEPAANGTEPLKTQITDREPRSSVSNARLSDTLQWLSGASKEESSDGNTQITFESKGRDNCAVTMTETRAKAGPDFFLGESFSLADIDPADIQVGKPRERNGEVFGRMSSSVGFHTTNYSEKIIHTSYTHSSEHHTASYFFFTNDSFAPRFAKALKTAAELCGGKPSIF